MRNEKITYERADLEIINLLATDLIATSGWELGNNDDSNTDPGGWT